jgi:hypothetical protein
LTITTYVALFALMDVVPGIVLWALSPTNSVRVWYPTLLSYLGEHLVAATATLVVMWLLLSAASKRIRTVGDKREFSLTIAWAFTFGFICLVVDMFAGMELALLQSHDGGLIRLWYTQRLPPGYFFVREPVYVVFGIILLTPITLWFHYQKHQTVAPPTA